MDRRKDKKTKNAPASPAAAPTAIKFKTPTVADMREAEPVRDEILSKWVELTEEEQYDDAHHYNVNEAWATLFNMNTCRKVTIAPAIQKKLNLVVGVNVSQEFPWKQIPFSLIRDHLLDYVDEPEFVFKAMQGYDPNETVLIGYAPLLTQDQDQDDLPEGDPFIFFMGTQDAKKALGIIRNIESYEKWKIKKNFIKKPRRWVSLGSEAEVNLTLQQRYPDEDIEIQSAYPLTIPASKEFSFRQAVDVRDGYIELVPVEGVEFKNVTRKRVTVAVQSAPELATLQQQTHLTFPTNAWAQYLYEIQGDADLDVSSDEEGAQRKSIRSIKSIKSIKGGQAAEQIIKTPVELSANAKYLFRMLDFNKINMYRNDYPTVDKKKIENYSNPTLNETICFANIEKSANRFVGAVDWYPSLAGLVVTAFTFSTAATIEPATKKIDIVQRSVIHPNPILLWSFSDNLNYKLEFESPLEVTALSFCPHNHNLLFGGAINGQLLIWDLMGRAERIDKEDVISTAQARYRFLISEYLNWAISMDEETVIAPATISALETSQKATITNIYWLSSRFYMSTFGKAGVDPMPETVNKIFMTTAADGTIAFWDLDAMKDKKPGAGYTRREQPKELSQSESSYKNKLLKPIFQVQYTEPLTSCYADYSLFKCIMLDTRRKRKATINFRIALEWNDPEKMTQSAIVTTLYGHVDRVLWIGLYQEDAKESVIDPVPFARVHDGPIVGLRKHPYFPRVFVTIGRNVFAVWKDDYSYTPIIWRKTVSDITSVAWSETRPGVLLLTHIDGNLEVWDFMVTDDGPCLDDILGGGVVTALCEHRPTEPEKVIGIGDYNSSFRMIKVPDVFCVRMSDEQDKFGAYLEREESRKRDIQQWEQEYYERNRDIIEAKRAAEVQARIEMERVEKEAAMTAARLALEEEDRIRAAQSGNERLNYTERMRRQWDALNLRRMMEILMSRMAVKEEELQRLTVLEKTRLRYEAAKKEEYLKVSQRVKEEIAEVRARILPKEKVDKQRTELIVAEVQGMLEMVEPYEEVEVDAMEHLGQMAEFENVEFLEFIKRGQHRRQLLNKSLGANTARMYWYKDEIGVLEEGHWGHETFLRATEDLLAREEARLAAIAAESVDYTYSEDISEEEAEAEDE